MRKNMIDSDFIKDAFNELSEDGRIETSVIDKYAFDINVSPAAIIGAISGSLLGRKSAEKQILKNHANNMPPSPSIGGSYYKEVDNIASNLTIMFTPLSVVYMVNNKGRNVSIDTIETGEMDDEMYGAWRRRDDRYFKNLMTNKMMGEIQLVEHMYAKRLLLKKDELKGTISKHASESMYSDEVTFPEMIDGVIDLKSIVEKTADSKVIEYLMDSTDDEQEVHIPWKLDRPISKYAGLLSGISGFFGLDTSKSELSSMKSNFVKPGYLNKNLKVGFMPDRVVFVVDNVAVSQLPTMSMNDEGFERFESGDAKYFEKIFKEESNTPPEAPSVAEQVVDSILFMEKNASEQDVFKKNNIHPMIYFDELTSKYGKEWINFDPDVLIEEIEKDYDTKVEETPMNKILTIQVLNNSTEPFTSPFIFEKCVRALNDKPVAFDEWQSNNSGGEIMFAIQVMDDLTPEDNIFDNFSESVLAYIVRILAEQDYYTIYVKDSVIDSELEQKFFDLLNSDLLNKRQKNTLSEMALEPNENIVSKEEDNSLIAGVSKDVLSKLRANSLYDGDKINLFLNSVSERAGISENSTNMIKKNVRKNLSIDIMLQKKQELLELQRKI